MNVTLDNAQDEGRNMLKEHQPPNTTEFIFEHVGAREYLS